MKSDFKYRDEGSIVLLYPESPKAESWIEENLQSGWALWHKGVVIDWRYFRPIYTAIVMEGFSIKPKK